jgi:hypothetical protein
MRKLLILLLLPIWCSAQTVIQQKPVKDNPSDPNFNHQVFQWSNGTFLYDFSVPTAMTLTLNNTPDRNGLIQLQTSDSTAYIRFNHHWYPFGKGSAPIADTISFRLHQFVNTGTSTNAVIGLDLTNLYNLTSRSYFLRSDSATKNLLYDTSNYIRSYLSGGIWHVTPIIRVGNGTTYTQLASSSVGEVSPGNVNSQSPVGSLVRFGTDTTYSFDGSMGQAKWIVYHLPHSAHTGDSTLMIGADGNIHKGVGGGGGGTTTNPLTLNNSGSGASSGATFDGSSAITLSYNTIGAAPLASPTFTGTPRAPTAAVGTNTTQIATTAFVTANTSASNGLTKTSGVIKLGGTLTQATTIPLDIYNLVIGNDISGIGTGTYFNINGSTVNTQVGNGGSYLGNYVIGATNVDNYLIGPSSKQTGVFVRSTAGTGFSAGINVLDQLNNVGITFDGAYEANYTATSATSKRYVDSAILAHGGGSVTAIGVTTANGVSGTSSGGTTPNLTISLGNITPTTISTTIKPATVYQTAAGTAGTDSVVVKHSGGIVSAIAPAYYAVASTTPSIKATADITAQSAAGNITTFTVGASTATFEIQAYLNITTISSNIIETQVTYTDENSVSQTANFYTQGATSQLISSTGNATYPPMVIRAKNATVITVKTTLTVTSGTLLMDTGARIVQL